MRGKTNIANNARPKHGVSIRHVICLRAILIEKGGGHDHHHHQLDVETWLEHSTYPRLPPEVTASQTTTKTSSTQDQASGVRCRLVTGSLLQHSHDL
jgi:hypothetical protein